MYADQEILQSLTPSGTRGRPAAALVVFGLLAWILVIYGETTAGMAAIWWRSETFAHGFVVIPIVLYLLWRRRFEIALIAPHPYLPALGALVVLGASWLLAVRVGVNSAAHFSMIAMIPCAVWAVLGTRALRRMAFPMAFLFFAVPFGEFLMPTLIDRTADVIILALRASGIPVYREGNFFTIPSGQWSVVEACSGLRYLIASSMVGCLFAYLFFRTPLRRGLFVAASIVVPIVANWIRAYLIVMIGHLSDNQLATGVDHLVYGWIFFGIVMLALFMIGARWREDTAPAGEHAFASDAVQTPRAYAGVLLATLLCTTVFPVIAAVGSRNVDAGDVRLLPIVGALGWNPAPEQLSAWRPDIEGATAWQAQTFTKDSVTVEAIVAYYAGSAAIKAVTSTNQLVGTTNNRWSQIGAGTAEMSKGDARNRVRTAVVTNGRKRLAIWQWFWVDGHVTSSELVAKFYQALSVLQGGHAPVAWVILVTPTERGEEDARARLAAFVSDMQQQWDTVLQHARTVQ